MADKKVPKIRFEGFHEDWESTSIGEIAGVSSGRDYKHLNPGSIPVYGTGGYMLSVDQALSYSTDAIGIGRKGTIDKPYVLRAPFWTVDTLFYVTPDSSTDLHFLNGQFNRVNWKSKDESTGVPSLSKGAVANVGVSTTSLDEQRQLGSLFSELDRLIADRRKKVAKFQQTKTSLFQKMFPQGDADEPELRLDGFSGAWERKKLGNMASEFQSGDFIPADQIVGDALYPVFGGNGLRGYTNTFNHEGFYALIGRQGALCGNVNTSDGKAYFTEHAIAVKADQAHDTRFLSHLLDIMNLGQYSAQSAQPGIAVGTVKAVEALTPHLEEQRAMGELFSGLDALMADEQRYVEKLKQAKISLLQKMFV